jgi:preprotein translocase subunit SecD
MSAATLMQACARHPSAGGRRVQLVLEVHQEASRIHAGRLDHAGDALRAADMVRYTAEMIGRRLAASGVDDAAVQQGRGGRITVDLPEVRDVTRIRVLATTTGLFEARPTAFPPDGGRGVSRQEVLAHYDGQPPSDVEILEASPFQGLPGVPPAVAGFFAVERRPVITNRDLANLRPGPGPLGAPIVEFRLKPMAASIFADFTGAHINSSLALVLDGKVVSAPVIKSRVDGMGIIEGNFSRAEVEDLVNILRNGPLPAEVTCLETHIQGP